MTFQLTRMGESRIFTVSKEGDMFTIYENCDYYYEQKLSRAELKQLGEELIALAEMP